MKKDKIWDYAISDDDRKIYHYIENISHSHSWDERVHKGQSVYPGLRSQIIQIPNREEGKRHFVSRGYREAGVAEIFEGIDL